MQYNRLRATSVTVTNKLILVSAIAVLISCNPKSESAKPVKEDNDSVYSTTAAPNQTSKTKEEPMNKGLFLISGTAQIEQPCGMNTQGSRIKCPSYRMIATTIAVIDKSTEQLVASIESNVSGEFSLTLKEGVYLLRPKKIPLMKVQTQEFTVTDKDLSELKITYKPAIQPR
jgi:hypothetical protein